MASRYHQVLGVSADASPAELKAAFRRLAHRYHPDISAEENATEKFVEIVEAYRALTAKTNSNAAAFKKTSVKGSTIFTAPPATSEEPTANTDKSAVDKQTRDKSARPLKGKDCHIDAHLSIEELYWGVELKVNPSSLCLGRRSKKDWRHSSLLNVKIHRGTRHGARLRLRGKGGVGKHGGEAGDIYLTIKLKPHERYEVSGDDLYVDMPLSRSEAQQGAVIDLVTPGGRVEVDVPAGIASGQSICVPHRGLPRSATEQGDLFGVVRLVNMQTRTDKLRKWPHLPHADSVRWRPVGNGRGNTIDVRV